MVSNSGLESNASAADSQELTSSPQQTYTYYHAGPLFTIGDLQSNVQLSQTITRLSGDKFQPILPQDLEQRGDVTPHGIRDTDIRALLSCDLALFVYDGAELDSGTVVEYMIAKMADIPSVILRSDFRGGGDQHSNAGAPAGDAWNLMSSFWPRTEGISVNSMALYKQFAAGQLSATGSDSASPSLYPGNAVIEHIGQLCVDALEKAHGTPSRMPKELRSHVYQWIGLMPGYRNGNDAKEVQAALELLDGKESKNMFG